MLFQVVIALGILNVWILRFGKSTEYRGADAQNLREEFEAYGFPFPVMLVVGALKLSCAAGLLGAFLYPELRYPSALGMAGLMTGALAMHCKVGDPIKKSLPAAAMLAMSLFVAFA